MRILILILLLPQLALCQLNVLNVVSQVNESQVAITFTLAPGNFCQGAILKRGFDPSRPDLFEQVGEITGVCGDQDFAATYTLHDFRPFENQLTYYQLFLGSEPMELLPVLVENFGAKGFRIYPNPASTETKIYFEETLVDPVTIHVYNMRGTLVFEQVQIRSQTFELPRNNLEPGVYSLHILHNGSYYEERLVFN